jgi:hypothetical protein
VNHVTLKPAVSSKLHSHFDVSCPYTCPLRCRPPSGKLCDIYTPNAYSKGISCTYLQDTKHRIASWHQALPVVSCMKEHTAHANAAVSDQVHVHMSWDAYVKDRNGITAGSLQQATIDRAPGCCIAAQAHQKLALHSAVLLDKKLPISFAITCFAACQSAREPVTLTWERVGP